MLGLFVIAAVMLIGAVAVGITAHLHRQDRIAPNSSVGLRIRATSTGNEAWYAGQRATVPYLWGTVVLFAVGGLSVFFVPTSAFALVIGIVVLAVLSLCAVAVAVGAKAARLAESMKVAA